MIRQVLFCDDDQALQRLIQKKFEKYKEQFSVLVADDGVMALEILKSNPISLLVSDLQMPKMDGYALLAHVRDHYPDIPVIVTTAFGKPKTKQALIEQGASAYIEKPIVIDDLASEVVSFLQKETEGGVLNNASLEMFIQLIEMEQKTCTIRVADKSTGSRGVLFFREGELINARIRTIQGNEAAYMIFSWREVSLSIENICREVNQRIHDDLQAILLEAMRLKDESDHGGLPMHEYDELEVSTEESPRSPEFSSDNFVPDPAEAGFEQAGDSPPKFSNPVDMVNHKFQICGKKIHGVESIRMSAEGDGILNAAARIGNAFGAGKLRGGYVSNGDPLDKILLRAEENLVIKVSPRCTRETIIDILTR